MKVLTWMLFKKPKFDQFTKKMEEQKNRTVDPLVSKIFERCLYDQIYSYFDKIFSRYQCGFRKGSSTHHILLTMIEKMKISRDKQFWAPILTDLSKSSDCIPYDLLIAKLNAYGFDQVALKLIHSYLCDRSQRVNVGSSFSKELDILFGVPQGSILWSTAIQYRYM